MLKLAKAILKTQQIRERSWNTILYRKSMMDAAEEACGIDVQMAMPVYLLCEAAWNEAQEWAKSIAYAAIEEEV